MAFNLKSSTGNNRVYIIGHHFGRTTHNYRGLKLHANDSVGSEASGHYQHTIQCLFAAFR